MTLSIVTIANAQFGELKNRQAPPQLAGITSVPSSAGAPPKSSPARSSSPLHHKYSSNPPLSPLYSFAIMSPSLLSPRLLTRQSLRNALRLNLARSFTSPGFSVEKVPDRIPHRGWVPTPYVTETVVCILKLCQLTDDLMNLWLTK
jgi:hypothetical protein